MIFHANKRFLWILLVDLLAALILFFSLFPTLLPGRIRRLIRRPNVIFIVLDAARADHFSCYGYPKNTTPCIDVIAENGVTFLNNFSPGTHTLESVPRFLSSRYFSIPIWQLGLWDWGIRNEDPIAILRTFDPEQIFLTEALSQHGYLTLLIHDNACFNKYSYLVKSFDEYSAFSPSRTRDKDMISATISWLEENKKERFFIYCHIMSPHEPYPPKEEDAEFLTGEGSSAIEALEKRMFLREVSEDARKWSRNELRILKKLYDSNLKHTDKWIGILYDRLKELDLLNKTLIIITSDHGENLGDHDWLTHGGPPWGSVTHVPLIMVYPPLIPPRVRVRGITESIDIMPTILDICGIKVPSNKSMDGTNLLPFVRKPETGKDAAFTNRSIRTREHLYILDKKLLYDLKNDPEERQNIAGETASLAKTLERRFNHFIKNYRKRYIQAQRKHPPDFPFYFLIHLFTVSPNDVFDTCFDRRKSIETVLEKAAPSKAWLLDYHTDGSGLFCIPDNGIPSSLTLSVGLPDGIYYVDILVELTKDTRISQITPNLQVQVAPESAPIFPERYETIKNKPGRYYYLSLGKIEVQGGRFTVKLTFTPPDKNPMAIRHIRFTPEHIFIEGTFEIMTEEKRQQKIENLKTLGYL